MLDVIDLGVFPEPDRWYLWLTILIPVILYAAVCTVTAKSNMKDDNDIGVYVLGFLLMVGAILVSTFATNASLDSQREDRILDAVRDAGYHNVVEVYSGFGDISAVDKDGMGYLFDFVDLPGHHVGLLEVQGDK